MRKVTVFTLTLGLLMLTVAHKTDAAKCTVINNSLFQLAVVHASWMNADGKYPEGFRVKGWFHIEPGKKRTFTAQNAIYVRVAPVYSDNDWPFKPANSTRDAAYSFQTEAYKMSLLERDLFTTVETSEGEVIYSSINRALLVRSDGFYEFTDNGTFKVSGDGRDALRRTFEQQDLADEGTYSCTSPVFSRTPVPKEKDYGDSGQAVTNETVVVEQYAVTTLFDLWNHTETLADDRAGPLILTVKFLDKDSEFFSEEKTKTIEKIANIWSFYSNIKFRFVESGRTDFDIKVEPDIKRDKDGNSKRDKHNQPIRIAKYSSYIGTSAKGKVMNLCFPDWANTSYEGKRRIILHEFGHALGFHHEHLNKRLDINYNVPDVLAFYKAKHGWDHETTKHNVLTGLDSSKWYFTEFDPHSIMLYPIKQYRTFDEKKYKLTHNPINFTYNTNLSGIDIAAIQRMYPPERTESGNGIKYAIFDYNISGQRDTPFIHGWRDWTRTFSLPSGTIIDIRNVTTRADQGYVKKWIRFELNGIKVTGRIEDGRWKYGEVDGYLVVTYGPE